MKHLLFILILSLSYPLKGQDSTFIKVHFLYGSKPKKKHKETESKWFGGIHGGHVGIEYAPNKIIDFVPNGKFHYFEKHQKRHSNFTFHDTINFWEIFGGDANSMKKATFTIPISSKQKQLLDSIVKAYDNKTPYDYAFFGMRCAAASYDILSQIGITKKYGRKQTYRRNFYPKRTRKKLIKLAKKNNWGISRQRGSRTRKWEKD